VINQLRGERERETKERERERERRKRERDERERERDERGKEEIKERDEKRETPVAEEHLFHVRCLMEIYAITLNKCLCTLHL